MEQYGRSIRQPGDCVMNPNIIDLHMHSTVSDGSDTPEELLGKVREAGVRLFSVTDHDAVMGCDAVRALLQGDDPAFMNGVEFSCRDEVGNYHILGYGYDPDAEPVRKIVETGHRFRQDKLSARLDYLESEFGFVFSEEDTAALKALYNPGKPHIGTLMVKYGYAETRREAIDRYIESIRFPSMKITPEDAIDGILRSGGIPVLAHPTFGRGDQFIEGDDMDRRIRHLMDFGLQGLEVFYSGFDAEIRGELLAFADRYGLYVTGGSDYHGTVKNVRLADTHLDEEAELPDGMKRFLRNVNMTHNPFQ